MNQVKMHNGVQIPSVGLGTWQITDRDEMKHLLADAYEAGYRMFDTAAAYCNEMAIGKALEALQLPREELFLSDKVWNTSRGYDNVRDACRRSLKKMKTDYFDLYLIHWPRPTLDYQDWKQLDIDTWRALEKLYKEGKVRAIGLSNFLPHHLDNILENCEIKPMVNQIEYHAGYTQEATVQYCKQHDILVQAWSPISRGRIFRDVTLMELAEKYQVSIAKLALRFCIQNGIVPLPKAASRERMRENMNLFDFEISDEDMKRINTIPQVGWSGEHPDRERVPAIVE